MSKVLFGMGPLAADLERMGLGDGAPTPATGRPTVSKPFILDELAVVVLGE